MEADRLLLYGRLCALAIIIAEVPRLRLVHDPMAFLRAHVALGTVLNADEAGSWEELHKRYEVYRINHQEAYSIGPRNFSAMRRAEIGHQDNRREANGDQVKRLAHLALKQKPSVDFSGYWQRHIETA